MYPVFVFRLSLYLRTPLLIESQGYHNHIHTMTKRLLILALLGVLVDFPANAQTNKYSLSKCASAYYSDSNNVSPGQKQAAPRDCIVGKPFPAFSATTINGKEYSEGEIVGFRIGSPTDKVGLEAIKSDFMAIIERELSR